jgi:K+-sensing histidine kinase KdpD
MITPAPGGGQDSFKKRPVWTSYLLAIVSSTLVVLIKMGMDRLFGVESAFLLLFTAVFFSALYGGTGPGLLAAVLTVAAGDYFLLRIALTS